MALLLGVGVGGTVWVCVASNEVCFSWVFSFLKECDLRVCLAEGSFAGSREGDADLASWFGRRCEGGRYMYSL
jgi:hypothetical protein